MDTSPPHIPRRMALPLSRIIEDQNARFHSDLADATDALFLLQTVAGGNTGRLRRRAAAEEARTPQEQATWARLENDTLSLAINLRAVRSANSNSNDSNSNKAPSNMNNDTGRSGTPGNVTPSGHNNAMNQQFLGVMKKSNSRSPSQQQHLDPNYSPQNRKESTHQNIESEMQHWKNRSELWHAFPPQFFMTLPPPKAHKPQNHQQQQQHQKKLSRQNSSHNTQMIQPLAENSSSMNTVSVNEPGVDHHNNSTSINSNLDSFGAFVSEENDSQQAEQQQEEAEEDEPDFYHLQHFHEQETCSLIQTIAPVLLRDKILGTVNQSGKASCATFPEFYDDSEILALISQHLEHLNMENGGCENNRSNNNKYMNQSTSFIDPTSADSASNYLAAVSAKNSQLRDEIAAFDQEGQALAAEQYYREKTRNEDNLSWAGQPQFDVLPQESSVKFWRSLISDLEKDLVLLQKSELQENKLKEQGRRNEAEQLHIKRTRSQKRRQKQFDLLDHKIAESEKSFEKLRIFVDYVHYCMSTGL